MKSAKSGCRNRPPSFDGLAERRSCSGRPRPDPPEPQRREETFLRFIGLAEKAGALGLALPGTFRVAQRLTPIAAGGLVIIMGVAVGILAGVVAYGRRGSLDRYAA